MSPWHDYFFNMRRRWHAGFGLRGIATGASATINLDTGLAHPARFVHATCIAMAILGGASPSEKAHRDLVILFGILTTGATFAHIRPDRLAR